MSHRVGCALRTHLAGEGSGHIHVTGKTSPQPLPPKNVGGERNVALCRFSALIQFQYVITI